MSNDVGSVPVRAAPGWCRRRIAGWVAFWNEREPPTCLAVIRIGVALMVISDLLAIAAHGAAPWLWAPHAPGTVSGAPADAPLYLRLFAATSGSATLLWAGLLVSAIGVGLGCFTPASSLAHVWLSAQAAVMNGSADRAIDRLIRIVLLILALSPCAAIWSIDARRRTGSFRGDASAAPAWPRYLIFGQLVLTYFGAGLAKGGTSWYPWGGYNALYLTLRDPVLSNVAPAFLESKLSHAFTQLGTAVTHLWELGAPLLLLAAFYRRTAERPGRIRRLFLRLPVRATYVAVGIVFHLTLALTLRLGIFPFAMLACFPAFFRPDELDGALRWCIAPFVRSTGLPDHAGRS